MPYEQTPPYEHISVRPLTPKIGAEVGQVDLSKPLAPPVAAEVRRALIEHGVIGFRDQTLSLEQQIAFAAQFGRLYIHPVADLTSKHPEVLPVYADETSTKALGEEWHSDASCDTEPPMGSILQLQEIPDVGGDTMFASMYAAYDALSPQIRQLLDGLTAIHDGGHVFRRRFDKNRHYPTTEQPIVIRHPESGRPALYVNAQYTTHIVQLKPAESDALLAFLYRHCETPEFHCRFTWRPGSVVFWDNRAVQHKAVFDYFPRRRVGTRVQVCGARMTAAH